MIQPGTKLIVQDNSGARLVECITVLKKKVEILENQGLLRLFLLKNYGIKVVLKLKKKKFVSRCYLKHVKILSENQVLD